MSHPNLLPYKWCILTNQSLKKKKKNKQTNKQKVKLEKHIHPSLRLRLRFEVPELQAQSILTQAMLFTVPSRTWAMFLRALFDDICVSVHETIHHLLHTYQVWRHSFVLTRRKSNSIIWCYCSTWFQEDIFSHWTARIDWNLVVKRVKMTIESRGQTSPVYMMKRTFPPGQQYESLSLTSFHVFSGKFSCWKSVTKNEWNVFNFVIP